MYVEKGSRVPADMVLLRTTEHSGSCFIRTDQLDGETDWKLKIAIPATQKLGGDEELLAMQGGGSIDSGHFSAGIGSAFWDAIQ